MTKLQRQSPEFMKEISFAELVKALDAKWGHTYKEENPFLVASRNEGNLNK